LRVAAGHHQPQKRYGAQHTARNLSEKYAENGGKGAISLLQEYVQCSKTCVAPQDRRVLQWSFGQHVSAGTLEFRATVAFALDEVPHHVVGGWHVSKKAAQRDTADRALGFFIGAWGEALLSEASGRPAVEPQGEQSLCSSSGPDSRASASSRLSPFALSSGESQRLEEFCISNPSCGGKGPAWTLRHDAGHFIASADLEILGVPHRLAGVPRGSEKDAIDAAARRILWYLRCPGFENVCELDPQALAITELDIPAPPADWIGDQEHWQATPTSGASATA